VCPRDSARDGQSEACASVSPIPSCFQADKPIEDPLPVGGRNAWPRVMHGQGHRARRSRQNYPNCSASWSNSTGVVQQIRDELTNPGGIDGRSGRWAFNS
jgi:hypothetical protein